MKRTLLARLVLRAVLGASVAAATFAPARAAMAADSAEAAYKKHMGNGVKLFQDKNYEAAIVEFQAAYEAKPKASPLVNVALCDKALFRYPQAIAALEKALAEHDLDAHDRESARKAIDEMRALLGYVTVEITPPEATLAIDGEDQPAGTAAKPVPLGPGTHKLGAHMDGYAPAEETVTVASGDHDRTVKLALVADRGFVRVHGGAPDVLISVDRRPVAQGEWAGLLAPGTHVVDLATRAGPIASIPVVVVAGKAIDVGAGTPAAQGAAHVEQPKRPPPPQMRGFYGMVAPTLFLPITTPSNFTADGSALGGAVGVRFGYRPITKLGVELMYRYSQVSVKGTLNDVTTGYPLTTSYALGSHRVGAGLRLMSSGKKLRFVATIQGGASFDAIDWACSEPPPSSLGSPSTSKQCAAASGTTGFVAGEVGLELDLGGVLLGLEIEQSLSGSEHLRRPDALQTFSDPLVELGGGARIGYATW